MPEKRYGIAPDSSEKLPLDSTALDDEWGNMRLRPAEFRPDDMSPRRGEQRSSERRTASRFGLHLPIQTWLDVAPGWHYEAHTVNISSRGMLFSLDGADPGSFNPSTQLSFNIALDTDAETQVILQGKGRVLRIDHSVDVACDSHLNTRIAAVFITHHISRL